MLNQWDRVRPAGALNSVILTVGCFACLTLLTGYLPADDWTQWRGNNRDGVWHETGVITSFEKSDLTPRWRKPIGTGYSSPTVAKGKVMLMDFDEANQNESVKCFDAKTGECKDRLV